MANVGPNKGGCWYCGEDTGELIFCHEFDTFIHRKCIQEHLDDQRDDPELEIIAKEFSMKPKENKI